MRDKIYTHYIAPPIPIYSYSYYMDNYEEYRKGAKPIFALERTPVVAFGCWFDKIEYVNCQEALILAGHYGFLEPAENSENFLGCWYDSCLTLEQFLGEIKEREEIA